MRTEFLCISVLGVALGLRVKLASCKSVLNLPVVYSTDRSKVVVPVLYSLLLCCLFYEAIYFMSYLVSFCSCVFSPFRKERANLSAFRTFVRFVLIWIIPFPLPLSVWEGLRFVIVALPGLFSYLFYTSSRIEDGCLWVCLHIVCQWFISMTLYLG